MDLLVEGVRLGVDSSMPPAPQSDQASVDALLSKRCPKAGSARSLKACPSFKSDMLRPPLASWD